MISINQNYEFHSYLSISKKNSLERPLLSPQLILTKKETEEIKLIKIICGIRPKNKNFKKSIFYNPYWEKYDIPNSFITESKKEKSDGSILIYKKKIPTNDFINGILPIKFYEEANKIKTQEIIKTLINWLTLEKIIYTLPIKQEKERFGKINFNRETATKITNNIYKYLTN